MADLKSAVLEANRLLPEWGLVISTQGNVSGFEPGRDRMIIKPSGIPYDRLKRSDLVTLDRSGRVTAGRGRPSVDWPHHLFLYREIPGLGGVVHTHSPFATAFAAAGLAVPCLTTGQADVFGGAIPVTPYADNRGDRIGRAILKTHRPGCPAVILGGHGLFAFGPDPVAAVKAARLAEYFARLNCFALLLGRAAGRELTGLAEAEVRKWNRRYQGGGYGQEPARRDGGRR